MVQEIHDLWLIVVILLCLQLVPINCEPGIARFKADTLQCTVGLNQQHLQSLHMKVQPMPEHKNQWSDEELQVDLRTKNVKRIWCHVFHRSR